ncbi:uncharacterized protein ACA1_179000 [Acanthamoeba castellanii str. Neff]|uniref:Uncharacterized protein n=1 Tax=Acanthamoeba castellanii (strain ATCC 30010 / Neff) TaxID=1257118 RepID=L8GSN0_ACACF|nr:uncharacterized protein ACA1_179000 [Acanthamoeba castellanii str. Neff]ELR16209.1 hypothetical protein ACA1_179000 [Acanthamoeba castellanii str. Neff]
MEDYQQFIKKIWDDFNKEAGSTIKPHKQCSTLVFNRHINTNQVQVELVKIIQECSMLKMLYKSIDTTITGGYRIKFWTMDHLDTFLRKHHIYDNNKKPHCKMISIYGCADQNRINLCKVDVVNKKRTDVPLEEQLVPHTQML